MTAWNFPIAIGLELTGEWVIEQWLWIPPSTLHMVFWQLGFADCYFSYWQVRTRFRRRDTPLPDAELAKKLIYDRRKYMEREAFPGEFATELPYGRIYDKKPMKLYLEAGKQYQWCICGTSRGQVSG